MTNRELQKLTENISKNYFHMPFVDHIYFNPRLFSTWGRYNLATHNIDINPKIIGDYSLEDLIDTIKHELCHYQLAKMGYKGPPHGKAFKILNAKVGGARGWEAVYAPAPKNSCKYKYVYRCQHCGQIYVWEHKIDTKKYGCGRCGGHLKQISSQYLSLSMRLKKILDG